MRFSACSSINVMWVLRETNMDKRFHCNFLLSLISNNEVGEGKEITGSFNKTVEDVRDDVIPELRFS